ncbi:uncharacterized protein MICPUCDRAFT_50182 [Micromonas pusilla CCMP1545]|uniref:Predicted protein n=1 Tax=Micromonas pusilla (strain CCMP1545) TaxID=564608 RepID=C1MHG5_MICPC|nr:uncharacterized protein MICPUCDRAFT_50182 [Micromonas pusilla CCMP1545]EEH60740.1 predicted protein [Micromonas pusilla CCMP1545]|eukprot:XP_003055488.1 predicted protein [Micromonas pusilla CCMP1545]
MSSGRSMRVRAPVSYSVKDMNQAKTPNWLSKTSVNAPAPKRAVKKPEPAVEPEKLALALAVVAADGEADAAKENDVDDGAVATVVKKKKGPKKGPKKEKNPPPAKNVAAKKKPGRKPAAATAAAAGKKVTAMGKAAAIAKDGLKRPASQFVVNEDPSEHASFKKHAGARPAKRQAREQLHSRFDAAASPEEPPVPRAW